MSIDCHNAIGCDTGPVVPPAAVPTGTAQGPFPTVIALSISTRAASSAAGQLFGQFAAGLGHVGPAAAAAIDHAADGANPGHRVEPAIDQVAAQAGDQRHLLLLLLPIGQQHGHRRDLAAELVDHLPQFVRPAGHFGDHHLHAADLGRVGDQLLDAPARPSDPRRPALRSCRSSLARASMRSGSSSGGTLSIPAARPRTVWTLADAAPARRGRSGP